VAKIGDSFVKVLGGCANVEDVCGFFNTRASRVPAIARIIEIEKETLK
jgi:hypothetical protein